MTPGLRVLAEKGSEPSCFPSGLSMLVIFVVGVQPWCTCPVVQRNARVTDKKRRGTIS
jgi:hypothetical protein